MPTQGNTLSVKRLFLSPIQLGGRCKHSMRENPSRAFGSRSLPDHQRPSVSRCNRVRGVVQPKPASFCLWGYTWCMNETAAEDGLSSELKSLVGWGATANQLARRLDRLPYLAHLTSFLAGHEGGAELTDRRAQSRQLLSLIENCVSGLAGTYRLDRSEKALAADSVREAFHWLLCLTRSARAYAAPQRRARAIAALSLSPVVTVDQWRRGGDLELSLMHILARALLSRTRQANPTPAYVVNRFDLVFQVDARGVIPQVEVLQDITSLTDALGHMTNKWEYPTDRRAGVVSLEPLLGCTLAAATYDKNRPGLLTARLAIPPLAKNETHTLAYRVRLETDKPAEQRLVYEPAIQVESLRMRIRFDHKRVPTLLWSFDGISALYVPGEGTADTVLTPTAEYWFTKQFRSLTIGRCYGIAWRW